MRNICGESLEAVLKKLAEDGRRIHSEPLVSQRLSQKTGNTLQIPAFLLGFDLHRFQFHFSFFGRLFTHARGQVRFFADHGFHALATIS